MKQVYTCIPSLLLVAVVALGGLAVGNPVRQDTVTRYYIIPSCSFVPPDENAGYSRGGGGFNAEDNDPFYASVILPDSAQVIEMKAWVRHDSTTTLDIEVSLWRLPITAFYTERMAYAVSVPIQGIIQVLVDSTIEYGLIDNASYFYHATVWLKNMNAHTLRGVLITYTVVEGTQVEETSEFTNASPVSPTVYPTPFVRRTAIDYVVPKREKVSIRIYDAAGRLVKTIVDGIMSQGSYTARWDGTDSRGRHIPSGSYFCTIKANGTEVTKVVQVK